MNNRLKTDPNDVAHFPFPEVRFMGMRQKTTIDVSRDMTVLRAFKAGFVGFKKDNYREWRTYKNNATGDRYSILIELSPLEYSNIRVEQDQLGPVLRCEIAGVMKELDRKKLSESENEEFQAMLDKGRGFHPDVKRQQKPTIYAPDGTKLN